MLIPAVICPKFLYLVNLQFIRLHHNYIITLLSGFTPSINIIRGWIPLSQFAFSFFVNNHPKWLAFNSLPPCYKRKRKHVQHLASGRGLDDHTCGLLLPLSGHLSPRVKQWICETWASFVQWKSSATIPKQLNKGCSLATPKLWGSMIVKH